MILATASSLDALHAHATKCLTAFPIQPLALSASCQVFNKSFMAHLKVFETQMLHSITNSLFSCLQRNI